MHRTVVVIGGTGPWWPKFYGYSINPEIHLYQLPPLGFIPHAVCMRTNPPRYQSPIIPMNPHTTALGSESLFRWNRKLSETTKMASGNPSIIRTEPERPYKTLGLMVPTTRSWRTISASPMDSTVAEIDPCTFL